MTVLHLNAVTLDHYAQMPGMAAAHGLTPDAPLLGHYLKDPANFALHCDGAVVLLLREGDGYAGHYLVPRGVPHHRSVPALKELMAYVFTTLGAGHISGTTPRGNRAALAMNEVLGFRPSGTLIDNLGRECARFEITREQWDS